MEILLSIKIAMLIALAALGWIAGRWLNVEAKSLSSLLMFVISPAVTFVSIMQAPTDDGIGKISVAAYFVACLFAATAFCLAKLAWSDSRANLFSFMAGTGNTGYFALPLVISMFDSRCCAVAVSIIVGVNLYEFTFGYFVTARGRFQIKECLLKVFSLPFL